MNDRDLIRKSKFLSRHLRHKPEALGLVLEPGGWVSVAALLEACRARRFPLTREELEEVVAHNDKQRFSFDEAGERIRANQGHSVDVDLQLTPEPPPSHLYHGTPARTADLVQRDGLKKMARHHVHLSPDVETARRVGARRGAPVIFRIDAEAMERDGHRFYRSANGVWLVDAVPPGCLERLP